MKIKMFTCLCCFATLLLSPACDNDDPVAAESIRFEASEISIKAGDSRQLIATVLPENAGNKTLSWNSSNPDVATVDAEGVVSAIKTGYTTVTASTEGGGISASCKVTVYTEVSHIALDPTSATLNIGETLKITATVTPDDAVDKTPIWSSSDESVATVDSEGSVKALSIGTAEIEAHIGIVVATCKITVQKALTHPAALFSEFCVGTTAGTFAASHDTGDIGFYDFDAAQASCPKGWHLPDKSELYAVSDCYDGVTIEQHCLFTGKADFSDVPEKAMIEGQLRNFTADYYTSTKKICYALKFKDASNEYLSAYRWSDYSADQPYFELRVRWLKGDDQKLTVKEIADENFWSSSNEVDIVRRFPAVGYQFASGTPSGANSVAYYWSSVEEKPSQSGSRRGLLLYFLKGNYGYTGAFAASWKCNVRCVQDN